MKSIIPTVITHPRTLVREGLRQVLSRSRFRTTHTAAKYDDLPGQTPDGQKRLCIIRLDEFVPTALDSLRRIRKACPDLIIVVVAQRDTGHDVLRALEAGVNSVLDQDICAERLVTSLELTSLGETVVPARFLQTIRTRFLDQPIAHAHHAIDTSTSTANRPGPIPTDEIAGIARRLSNREVSILRLLTAGSSNKRIANNLGITEATVKVHNKSILRKIRVQNRTQAAVWAHNNLAPAATSVEP